MLDRELTGHFWLPGRPPDGSFSGVAGVLNFSRKDGLLIELSDRLSEEEEFEPSDSVDVMLGVAHDGTEITLLDCLLLRWNRSLSSGGWEIHKASYQSQQALLGALLPDETDRMFRDVVVMIDGLDSWLPSSGFSTDFPPDRATASTASYTPPPSYVAETNLGTLTLEPYLERRAERRSVVLREGWRFDMDLDSPLRLGEVASRVTQPLLNLVTLVTQRPAVIEKLSLYADSAPEPRAPGFFRPIEVLYPPIGKLEPAADYRRPLVALADTASDFNDLITRWLAVSADNDLGPVLGSFFGIQYAPPGFVELRFLTMATALESYHERRHPGASKITSKSFERRTSILTELAAQSEDFRSGDRKWLKGVLKTANRAALDQRLAMLLTGVEDALPNPIPEVRRVSEKLATTRNHLAHGTDKLAKRALTGLDRFWGEQLLRLTLVTLLLKELGLSGPFIAESWEKFPWYAWAWEGIGTIDWS